MVGSRFPSESLPIDLDPQEATASADADLARLEISLQQGCGDLANLAIFNRTSTSCQRRLL
jgi:hypothetical protein